MGKVKKDEKSIREAPASPPRGPDMEIEQFLKMAERLAEGADLGAQQTHELAGMDFCGAGELVSAFNNLLEEVKRNLPDPFILGIPKASAAIEARDLPALTSQLVERLRALSRFSAKSYEEFRRFMSYVRTASQPGSPAAQAIEEHAGAWKKLADR